VRLYSYSRLLKLGNDLIKSGNRSFLDANIDPEAPNMLIFTSGTTELAKEFYSLKKYLFGYSGSDGLYLCGQQRFRFVHITAPPHI
jgi:acyl-CoA synthetase (AMP-forming)/AMP-acid ligase II